MWTISDEQMEAVTESLAKNADEIKEYTASNEATSANNTANGDSQNSSSTDSSQQAAESSPANNGTNSTWATEPVLPCEQVEVVSIAVGTVTPKADPRILSAVWRENSGDKDKISVLKYEAKCFIEVKTQGFDDDDELTLEIKENLDDATTLKTINLKIKNNEAQTESEDDKALTADEDWYRKQFIVQVASDKTELFEGELVNVVCCEHAIKLDDEGELIKELNVKLAGFGEQGNTVPKNKFNEMTENAVKQFQRDYMKVPQTGIVCKHFLEKLDEFCDAYYLKIDTDKNFKVKCPCTTRTASTHSCTGFGKGRSGDLKIEHKYKDYLKEHQLKEKIKEAKTDEEKKKLEGDLSTLSILKEDVNYTGVEKPGIHRSLLWAVSAMVFYLDKIETGENLTIGKFFSNYRCKGDNIDKFNVKLNEKKNKNEITKRTSSNHMGNAIDIHVYKNGEYPQYANRQVPCDKIRELFVQYTGAQIRWEGKDLFSLEPSEGSGDLAKRWVHIDCSKFLSLYQAKDFYCTTESTLKGEKLMDLSKTLDNAKFEKINDCNYIASKVTSSKILKTLWIGLVQNTNSILFKDDKWTASSVAGLNGNNYRKQNIVTILEEKGDEYKIQPRGDKTKKIGWVNKEYIKEICKHEKSK